MQPQRPDLVAKAVADSVAAGVIRSDQCEDLVIVCGVFIAPTAEDNKKIYDYNYAATKLAIQNAMGGKPTAAEVAQLLLVQLLLQIDPAHSVGDIFAVRHLLPGPLPRAQCASAPAWC